MKTLVTKSYNRKDTFEIVDEYPDGYIVWPIGRQNFPFEGYIPLAKITDESYQIDLNTLKAIKIDSCTADYILKEATIRGMDRATFQYIISSLIR